MPSPHDSIVLGGAVELLSVRTLPSAFGMSYAASLAFLRALRVPVLYIGKEVFFLRSALEEALFSLLDFGSTGFRAPGSRAKMRTTAALSDIPVTLPDSILAAKTRAPRQRRIATATRDHRGRAKRALRSLLSSDANALRSAPVLTRPARPPSPADTSPADEETSP